MESATDRSNPNRVRYLTRGEDEPLPLSEVRNRSDIEGFTLTYRCPYCDEENVAVHSLPLPSETVDICDGCGRENEVAHVRGRPVQVCASPTGSKEVSVNAVENAAERLGEQRRARFDGEQASSAAVTGIRLLNWVYLSGLVLATSAMAATVGLALSTPIGVENLLHIHVAGMLTAVALFGISVSVRRATVRLAQRWGIRKDAAVEHSKFLSHGQERDVTRSKDVEKSRQAERKKETVPR